MVFQVSPRLMKVSFAVFSFPRNQVEIQHSPALVGTKGEAITSLASGTDHVLALTKSRSRALFFFFLPLPPRKVAPSVRREPDRLPMACICGCRLLAAR